MAEAISLEEAQKEIEEIARLKGFFTDAFRQEAEEEARNGRTNTLQAMQGGEEIRKDLEQALKILSTDLYRSSARFLMEVIQNADDNSYTSGQTPTVSISVLPEYVKIECNEDGFSKENIKALCRTGQSSKKPGQGYTGEKGIGFKSVFKIAKRAHIRSGSYFFQLDQTRQLGMITPQWDKEFFDSHVREQQTTILLDSILDHTSDFATALKDDIDVINPVLILFLRRIQLLHLKLFDSSSVLEPIISKSFRRISSAFEPHVVSLEDESTNAKLHWFKHSQIFRTSGNEPRRAGMERTEIVLAFPVTISSSTVSYSPLISNQNLVFAYLPLGNFGFKFVIQADFLTTSNRQEIDEDSPWNKNIARKIRQAFISAIKKLNRQDWAKGKDMQTLWPLYLNSETNGHSAYWSTISRALNRRLSVADVIKNRDGSFGMPCNIKFLDWAHGRNGEPIFGHGCDYVSSDYPDSVREKLSLMGVTAPNWEWVCDKLEDLHSEGRLHIETRDKDWYSDLAKTILRAQDGMHSELCTLRIGKIPLIPMADGTWRCSPSNNDPIYFPVSQGTIIPPGLPLSLVEKEASLCPDRKALFRLLGVTDCDVSSVISQILNHHMNVRRASSIHVVAHVKYLYQMQAHLKPGSLENIYFVCSKSQTLRRNTALYADISTDGKLRQLFSGHSEAYFLNDSYFEGLEPTEKTRFADWLCKTTPVALAPRFRHLSHFGSDQLHNDFRWLLANKRSKVLNVLRQNWKDYSQVCTSGIRSELSKQKFTCESNVRVALHSTYIPLFGLVEKMEVFGDADDCDFLYLPWGKPEDWKFLSNFGVGMDEDLDFHLWVLNQRGFKHSKDVERSKQLYLAIQSLAYTPEEEDRVRQAFAGYVVDTFNDNSSCLDDCIWQGPEGFSRKTVLAPVYGHELHRLFQGILNVQNMSSNDALEHLHDLRLRTSSTMEEIAEVYALIQRLCAHTFTTQKSTLCIALPSASGFDLTWKTPSQCVWDDSEFTQNKLKLESKIAIRQIIEQHAPTVKAFFTDTLKLPNAGILELLDDLAKMQEEERDEPERVYLLYERIQNHRRQYTGRINHSFKHRPLVFLRGMNGQRGRWLSLEDCIWTRSALRRVHALMPSLNQYKGLFRETLHVENATTRMLVDELLRETSSVTPAKNKMGYQYVKELILELAHQRMNDGDLRRLDGKRCWPCCIKASSRHGFRSIGEFYVNDRQDLFEIFSKSETFLDFDFTISRDLKKLLCSRGCETFLSDTVVEETESQVSIEQDREFIKDLRRRAAALLKYFDFAGCTSPFQLESLLKNVEVWVSQDIKTHYRLHGTTVTKTEGGSSVKISTDLDGNTKLSVFVSADKDTRNCALFTDFPQQLITALKITPSNLADLHSLLQVPLVSLNRFLVRQGIISGHETYNYAEESAESSADEDSDSESGGSDNHNTNDLPTRARFSSPGSGLSGFTSASARIETRGTSLRPHLGDHSSARSQGNLDVSSNEVLRERPVTPRAPATGIYNEINRTQNRERLRGFFQNRNSTNDVFDMSTIRNTLEIAEPTSVSSSPQVDRSPRRQAGLMPNRSGEEMARDFEVGFLGEQFIYHLLHDTFELPDFTGEDNWTSSLRSRAGFSSYGREVTDFTYKDTTGALTRHFQTIQHPYATPGWLSTILDDGNVPTYQLEVKSTTSEDPRTAFYMSRNQHQLAKDLNVTSSTPARVYVIMRVSGLSALEDGAQHQPQWRAYLDPYSLGEADLLKFTAPTRLPNYSAISTYEGWSNAKEQVPVSTTR